MIRANNSTIKHYEKDAAPPIGDMLGMMIISVLSSNRVLFFIVITLLSGN